MVSYVTLFLSKYDGRLQRVDYVLHRFFDQAMKLNEFMIRIPCYVIEI